MTEKLFYDGIYGQDAIHFVREIIHIITIEDKIKNNNGVIKPHAHNKLFQIFLLKSGTLNLTINDYTIELEGVSFFTIPKNVLHSLSVASDAKGWLITLSDLALERMLVLDTDIIFDIDEVTIAKMNLENILFENLYTTIHKCINEFNGNLPGKNFALEYLVGMVLIRLYRIPKDHKQSLKSTDNAYKIYYRRFLQLIKEDYSFKQKIEVYAEKLSISAGHLNRICKNVSGKSPKDIIIDYFISEAKNKLSHFEMTIVEVSFILGFEDASYFSRLFKIKVNLSPRDYRKKIGLK